MLLYALRNQIKHLVAVKVARTRQRTAYKYDTRPKCTEKRVALALAKAKSTQEQSTQATLDYQTSLSLYTSYVYKRDQWLNSIDSKRRDIKKDIRHFLLAYGYLRGVDYKSMEGKCGEDNSPNALRIAGLIDHFRDDCGDYVSKAMIKDWLAGETVGLVSTTILEEHSRESV